MATHLAHITLLHRVVRPRPHGPLHLVHILFSTDTHRETEHAQVWERGLETVDRLGSEDFELFGHCNVLWGLCMACTFVFILESECKRQCTPLVL